MEISVSIRMEIVKRNEEHQEFPVTEEDKEKIDSWR